MRFIRVAHAREPKMDRSEVQRFLAEVARYPMALIYNDSIRFRELSPECVRLSAFDDDTYVDLISNSDSEICGVKTSTRYRDKQQQRCEGRLVD